MDLSEMSRNILETIRQEDYEYHFKHDMYIVRKKASDYQGNY